MNIEDQFSRLGWRLFYCPAPKCHRPLTAPKAVCCMEHWQELPYGLRKKLRKFDTRNLGQAYTEALKKCMRVWSGEPPPPLRGPHIIQDPNGGPGVTIDG